MCVHRCTDLWWLSVLRSWLPRQQHILGPADLRTERACAGDEAMLPWGCSGSQNPAPAGVGLGKGPDGGGAQIPVKFIAVLDSFRYCSPGHLLVSCYPKKQSPEVGELNNELSEASCEHQMPADPTRPQPNSSCHQKRGEGHLMTLALPISCLLGLSLLKVCAQGAMLTAGLPEDCGVPACKPHTL